MEVTADKVYETDLNHPLLTSNGRCSGAIVRDNRTNPQTQCERPNIERKFAEQGTLLGTPLKLRPSCKGGKKYTGLGKVRDCGLAKLSVQVLLPCIVVNCKKTEKLNIVPCQL